MHVINACPFVSFHLHFGQYEVVFKSCAGGLVIWSRNFISGEPRGLPQGWHSSQHMHCCGLNTKTFHYGWWIHWQMVTARRPLLLPSWLPLAPPGPPPDPAAKGLTLGTGGGKGSASQMLLEGTILLLSCKYCVHCPGHYEMCAMKSETCDQMHLYTP